MVGDKIAAGELVEVIAGIGLGVDAGRIERRRRQIVGLRSGLGGRCGRGRLLGGRRRQKSERSTGENCKKTRVAGDLCRRFAGADVDHVKIP